MTLPFDHEFVVGDKLSSLDVFATVREAVDERVDTANGSDRVHSRLPEPGDYALGFGPGFNPGDEGVDTGGWAKAQAALWSASLNYVLALRRDANADAGSDEEFTDPQDYTVFYSPAVYGASGGMVPLPEYPPVPNDWPFPDGFTRKRPREIRSLADDGELGWVARLSASINTTETPLEERVHSGKLFRRKTVVVSAPGVVPAVTAPRWVEETGAASLAYGPDVVTEFGTIQGVDYVGVWIPNELRDAARRLRWTFSPVEWTVPTAETYAQFSQAESGVYVTTAGEHAAIVAAVEAEVTARWGTTAAGAAPIGTDFSEVYRAGKSTGPTGSPGAPGSSSYVANFLASLTYVVRGVNASHAYPKITSLPLWDRTKNIEWLVAGWYPTDHTHGFDNFGQEIEKERVTRRGAIGSYQGMDALGPKVGDATVMPSLALGPAGVLERGFIAGGGAVVKWNVPGGFKQQ